MYLEWWQQINTYFYRFHCLKWHVRCSYLHSLYCILHLDSKFAWSTNLRIWGLTNPRRSWANFNTADTAIGFHIVLATAISREGPLLLCLHRLALSIAAPCDFKARDFNVEWVRLWYLWGMFKETTHSANIQWQITAQYVAMSKTTEGRMMLQDLDFIAP